MPKAGRLAERLVFGRAAEVRHAAFAANRFQQPTLARRARLLGGQPGADHQSAFGPQDPMRLREEGAVCPACARSFRSRSRRRMIPRAIRSSASHRAGIRDSHSPSRSCLRDGELRGRNRDAGDLATARRQHARGGSVAAADVANARAVLDRCLLRYEIDQLQDGLLATFAAGPPEAVMHMVAPDIAIEMIELIVMRRDIFAPDLCAGGNHLLRRALTAIWPHRRHAARRSQIPSSLDRRAR